MPSPKRSEKDQTPKRSRKVMLKVKTPPVTPTPITQEAKPVPPPQPIREAISSDDESEPEKETKIETQPQIIEKEAEKEIVTENDKDTTLEENESLDKLRVSFFYNEFSIQLLVQLIDTPYFCLFGKCLFN